MADPTADEFFKAGANNYLCFGPIALQAEGQPGWFRKIELILLKQP